MVTDRTELPAAVSAAVRILSEHRGSRDASGLCIKTPNSASTRLSRARTGNLRSQGTSHFGERLDLLRVSAIAKFPQLRHTAFADTRRTTNPTGDGVQTYFFVVE